MRKRQEDQDMLPEVTAMWNQRAKRAFPIIRQFSRLMRPGGTGPKRRKA